MVDLHGSSANTENLLRIRSGPTNRLKETMQLFRILCSGVSVSVFGLCVKLAETMLQLVILVVAVTVGPGCERLV